MAEFNYLVSSRLRKHALGRCTPAQRGFKCDEQLAVLSSVHPDMAERPMGVASRLACGISISEFT